MQHSTMPPSRGGHPESRSEVVLGFGPARDAAERRLAQEGVVLPVPQTAEWLRALGYGDSALIICTAASRANAALGIGIGRSRSLPGHTIYRVERLAGCADADSETALLQRVTDMARRDPRCLRVHLELFERSEDRRARLGSVLQRLGFAKAATPTAYLRTPSLDLTSSEADLFARCSSSARRNVRAPEKRGFRLVPLGDPSYAPKLEALMDEAFQRTGGTTRRLPWSTILAMSGTSPQRSRVVGLFQPNETGSDGLVAFAWGCVNGAYVTYEAGAATRNQDLGNLALSYAPLWNLIVWAKQVGATWFDFGGISSPPGSAPSDDPLAGISDFKRFFCERIVEGGEDWILEPRPLRALLSRTLRAAASRVRA